MKFVSVSILIILSMAAAPTASASILDKCKQGLGSLWKKVGPLPEDTRNPREVLGERIDTLTEKIGEQDPFGVNMASNRKYTEAIRDAFKREGLDWEKLNGIERKLEQGQDLSSSEKRTVDNAISRAKVKNQKPLTGKETVEEMSMERTLLRRLLDIKEKMPDEQKNGKGKGGGKSGKESEKDQKNDKKNESNKEGKGTQNQGNGAGNSSSTTKNEKTDKNDKQPSKPQDPKNQEGQGSAQENQNSESHGSSGQQHDEQKTPPQGQGHESQDHQSQESQGARPENKPAQPDKQQGAEKKNSSIRDMINQFKDGRSDKDREKEVQDQREKPKVQDSYNNFKNMSEALLRYLYLWELRKFRSGRELKAGLQNLFNLLQTAADQFEPHKLQQYMRLVQNQMSLLSGENLSHDTMSEYISNMRTALTNRDMKQLYDNALPIYRVLREINRYDNMTKGEETLLYGLEKLLESLKSKEDGTKNAVTEKFYRQLVGDISRLEMRDKFGNDLLEPGNIAQQKFYDAITSGALWPFRFMTFLRPYLNMRSKKLYSFAPQVNPYGKFSTHASGPQGIRYTDDIINYDDFEEVESRPQLLLNLAEGTQRYYERRKERHFPSISRKAVKKVSFLIPDISTSMDGLRAIVRNMFVAGYIDFYTSELMSEYDVTHKTGRNVGEHVMYYMPFNEAPGEITPIKTRNFAIQFSKSLTTEPSGNSGGSTSIFNALWKALEHIHQAKLAKNGDLQYATLVLISDGDDGNLQLPLLEAKLKEINSMGDHTQIVINIILMSNENEQLKGFARMSSMSREDQNAESTFNYKFIPQASMEEYKRESKKPVKVEGFEAYKPISGDTYWTSEQGPIVRQAVDMIAGATAAVGHDSSQSNILAQKIFKQLKRTFDPKALPAGMKSKSVLSKTRKILETIDEFLEHFARSGVALDARALFLDKLVYDLCLEQGINRKFFEEGLTDQEFIRYRSRVTAWLEGPRGVPQ